MKSKTIYRYPYNAKPEDDLKVFLSDIICEQVVKVNCRNGQFFCIIKDKVTFKNKEIILSAVIIFAVLFSMPYKLRAIGVSPIRRLAPEIHRPAREHFQPYTRTVAEPVDKVKFILPREKVALLMFLDPKNEELLKKLTKIRCGDNRLVDLLWLSLFLYAMTLYPDQAAILLQQLGRFNAPGLGNNPPGYLNTQSCQSTVIQSQFDSENCIPWPWQWQGTICSQTESFRKTDGTLDINQGYEEILRRARYSENFECSRYRFITLCTENGKISAKQMQEAITALQLEADGIVSNVRRDPVAAENGILGLDFLIDGPNGETHLEIKGPVDSRIKLAANQPASIRKQARSIGRKIHYQLNEWVKTDKQVTKPESAAKILTVVDLFNVSVDEKHQMWTSIQAAAENAVETRQAPTVMNIKYINNVINR